MKLEELMLKIKEKPELSGISNKIVMEAINSYLSKGKILLSKLSPSDIKLVVKDIRKELRNLSGRFSVEIDNSENKQNLIENHPSTKDRLEFYPELKNIIKNLKVKSILDLGCGLNPLELASKDYIYYASDIKENELEIIKSFFEKNNINGRVFVYDLRKIDNSLPKSDLVLLFNVLEIIENKGHKLAEKIINSLECKYILISFSMKTLSGKPMNHPQRGWIERLLTRLGYTFKIYKSKKEIFYLASKK